MIWRTALALMVMVGTVAAKPTTRPTAVDSTRPTAEAGATLRLSGGKLTFKSDAPRIAYIELDKPVIEKPAGFSLLGGDGMTLESVLRRLSAARDDKELRGVLITLGQTEFNLAQAQEIRDALVEIRKAGKRTFVYADAYDTAGYVMASGATDVCLLEGGEIEIPGVGIETMFARGLLDKVGVKADYVQIGEYKGADEEMTRTEASPELRGEMNKIVESLYGQITDGIASHRNVPVSTVKELVDQALVPARLARDRGLVDHLVDIDGLRTLMGKELSRQVELVHDYGMPERPEIDLSNPFVLMALLTAKTPVSDKTAIAVVYAEGLIVDGEGGSGMGGDGSVGSEDIRTAMRIAARDPNIKAIVLRIDSPGGSALASEAMWQAARRAAGAKPLIVSVGSMAASGGYYLASAGDRIFADPTAIVGSIGVVGGKYVLKDLFDKVGLHTETFARGANAGLFSMNQPFSDQQRRLVTNWMRQTYDQFTQRVMSTRKGKIKDIDDVARGRIFAARQARDLGMVDELGGMQAAIQYAAGKVNLKSGDYEIRVVPHPRTLGDILRDDKPQAAMAFQPKMTLAEDSLLRLLPRQARSLILRQVQALMLLQDRPVMLVSPYQLQVR